MNIYMAYSRRLGPLEGAMLVFAHTVREAKKFAYQCADVSDICGNEYTDLAVNKIRNKDWLYEDADQKKLAAGMPHVVWNMKTCKNCETWGGSPIGEDGLCEECHEDAQWEDEP